MEIKPKTIFDLIADVTVNKVAWENQEEYDKRSWNTFMVNKFLSMNYELVEIVAFLQSYTAQLSPEMSYRVYLDVLPKKKFFSKYIGNTKTKSERLVKFISEVKQMSISDSEELVERCEVNVLKEFLTSYGFDTGTIKKDFKL